MSVDMAIDHRLFLMKHRDYRICNNVKRENWQRRRSSTDGTRTAQCLQPNIHSHTQTHIDSHTDG